MFRPSRRVPAARRCTNSRMPRSEAYSIVADCVAQAKREDTLLKQLLTLEFHRSPSLRGSPGPVVSAIHEFYGSMVEDAIARGEIPGDTDPAAVVNVMLARFVGIGFTPDSLSIQTTCR